MIHQSAFYKELKGKSAVLISYCEVGKKKISSLLAVKFILKSPVARVHIFYILLSLNRILTLGIK